VIGWPSSSTREVDRGRIRVARPREHRDADRAALDQDHFVSVRSFASCGDVAAAKVNRADRVHAIVMLVAALGTLAYWTAYFTAGAVQTSDDAAYVAFENAFPLADAYMATCYVAAAILLLKGRAAAIPIGIAAGSAMVFLGAMDTLFNLEHGKYADMTAEMTVETIINLMCFVLGPVTMIRLWRARSRFAR
jgi:hypothetical protein